MEIGINYATLRLFRTCNYSCSYCFLSDEQRHSAFGRIATEDGMMRVKQFFDAHGEWHIHLTGGEPSIHPHFVDFYKMLSENHYVNMVTNNSMKEGVLKRFISEVKPDKVDYIQCSLQEHDQNKDNFKVFLGKMKVLRRNNFKAYVSYVPTPGRLAQAEEYYRIFSENGIPFVVQIYSGMFDNKKYPEAFTEDEKHYMNKCSVSSIYKAINSFGYWESAGKECSAGYKRILADCITGNVYRCLMDKEIIGNIFENCLKLSGNYGTCLYENCTCVYEMPLCTEGLLYKDFGQFLGNAGNYDDEIIGDYRKSLVKAVESERFIELGVKRNLEAFAEMRKKVVAALFLDCRDKKIGIFGAGAHTKNMLQDYKRFIGERDFEVLYFDSNKDRVGQKFLDGSIYSIGDINKLGIDKLIISSFSYQDEMYDAVMALRPEMEVVKTYGENDKAALFVNASVQNKIISDIDEGTREPHIELARQTGTCAYGL